MAMFIHKFFCGTLCRIVPFSHKNNGCIRWRSCTKVTYYIISLVVYIYYKCTIRLQYKDSFKWIPFGTTIWLIQQIKDIIVKLFYQGQRLDKLAVNVLTWWVPPLIHNKSATTCINIFFKQHSLDKTRTSTALQANTSEQGEGWKQMSARQEHESQHWQNQCSTVSM